MSPEEIAYNNGWSYRFVMLSAMDLSGWSKPSSSLTSSERGPKLRAAVRG